MATQNAGNAQQPQAARPTNDPNQSIFNTGATQPIKMMPSAPDREFPTGDQNPQPEPIRDPEAPPPAPELEEKKDCCFGFSRKCCIITWIVVAVIVVLIIIIAIAVYFGTEESSSIAITGPTTMITEKPAS